MLMFFKIHLVQLFVRSHGYFIASLIKNRYTAQSNCSGRFKVKLVDVMFEIELIHFPTMKS